MRTVQSTESASVTSEYMLLVKDGTVVNSNWSDCVTAELSVGNGCTAYLFDSLDDLRMYAASKELDFPTDIVIDGGNIQIA